MTTPSTAMKRAVTFAQIKLGRSGECEELREVDARTIGNLSLLNNLEGIPNNRHYHPVRLQLFRRNTVIVDGETLMGDPFEITPQYFLGEYKTLSEALRNAGEHPSEVLRKFSRDRVSHVFFDSANWGHYALSNGINREEGYTLLPDQLFGRDAMAFMPQHSPLTVTLEKTYRNPEAPALKKVA